MENLSNIILGIDPGIARMGYGVIKYQNPKLECIDYGTLETSVGLDAHLRLGDLYAKLKDIIKIHKPDTISIEDIFYFKNQKTFVQVSQARGIALLSAANSGKNCYSFTPLQIKQAVTGYGRAEKKQVQEMIKTILKLEKIPKPDDSADALAVAICCAHSLKSLNFLKE